ncbi:PTS transporter subunit EIIC [Erysipelothrix rhusiopathiae]|uniref:PTS transporter subunit EIIC n=1 Tax=Erysipelothrix rhusiopathiae TaxID=1648 RepID=UPI00202B8C79|nr:PTS transporter subunit EIIC [Erysipelothrix rhusiopathiae]URQ77514.1 PTS transporter subunit EIIC [Erysipelothrix rhusiopathiae]
MKKKVFDFLQQLGRTFMLPIALLPFAGLLLGLGATFTNPSLIEMYHLEGVLAQTGVLYKILVIMKSCGEVVFANLPLLFAIGVAFGMARESKEVASLAAAIAYLMMNVAMAATIEQFGNLEYLMQTSGLITHVLGIENTLNTGVFGGIIVGIMVSVLHNKFYQIEFNDAFSFFSGTRFIPIISSVFAIGLGILFVWIWPSIAFGIASLGVAISKMGYLGTFIYGFIYRALIPLGLHHVFYLPFWQTALGGSTVVAGTVVEGAQNIVFAQLAAGIPVDPSYARFFSGLFPFMIFGFPAAALAMYKTAYPENKAKVKGLLVSASITSIVTGITEPIEFSFLFASPFLYFGVHVVLAAFSFMLMHILSVGVGLTFSGGLLDLILYGILPGNQMTHWIPIVAVGLIYGLIYYFVFTFAIKKFDLKTPGREKNGNVQLYTKKDLKDKEDVSALIVEALGGQGNIVTVDNCATRLRIEVTDANRVNKDQLSQTGAAGSLISGNTVQVIYGPKVTNIKTKIDHYLNKK